MGDISVQPRLGGLGCTDRRESNSFGVMSLFAQESADAIEGIRCVPCSFFYG